MKGKKLAALFCCMSLLSGVLPAALAADASAPAVSDRFSESLMDRENTYAAYLESISDLRRRPVPSRCLPTALPSAGKPSSRRYTKEKTR